MPAIKKPYWIEKLSSDSLHMAESLNLTDEDAERLKSWVVSVAMNNFVAGNNAGIYWSRHGKTKAAELLQTLIDE